MFNNTQVRSPAEAFRKLSTQFVSTKAEAITFTKFKKDDVVTIKDQGNTVWDLVETSSVTPNGRNIISAANGLSLQLRPESELFTIEARTWYVDPVNGTDAFGFGVSSGAGAFKTIQYAHDQIPSMIFHQQTIQLADGSHSLNYLPSTQSTDLPRPAILFARGKFIAARTQKNGNNLEGGIIIKGNASNPENVIVEVGNTYTYGIYNSQGQLGLQDFHIKTDALATDVNNLLVSHRMDSYVHCLNVTCDGRDKTVTDRAIHTESGGHIEFTTTLTATEIKNCAILVSTLGPGENITLSGQIELDSADTGIQARKNSKISFEGSGLTGQTISNCSNEAISALEGAFIGFRGTDDSNHIVINGDVRGEANSVLDFIYTDINGQADYKNGVTAKYNNADYQDRIIAESSNLWFTNSNSYISPSTQNTGLKPVILRDGSKVFDEGGNAFVGSGGLSLHARDGVDLSISANGTTITVPDELEAVIRLNTGADRTGCLLSAGKYEYQTVEIFSFSGFFVEIVEGSTSTIAGNSIRLSGAASSTHYQGVKFVWFDGRWREIGTSRRGA